jgi:hypothetical protein
MVGEIFRILKPGNGWAQFGEVSPMMYHKNEIPEDCVLPVVRSLANVFTEPQYLDFTQRFFARRDTPVRGGKHLRPLLEASGFVDIGFVEKIIDIGDWRGGMALGLFCSHANLG